MNNNQVYLNGVSGRDYYRCKDAPDMAYKWSCIDRTAIEVTVWLTVPHHPIVLNSHTCVLPLITNAGREHQAEFIVQQMCLDICYKLRVGIKQVPEMTTPFKETSSLRDVAKNFLVLVENFEDIDPIVTLSKDYISHPDGSGQEVESVSPYGAMVMQYLASGDKVDFFIHLPQLNDVMSETRPTRFYMYMPPSVRRGLDHCMTLLNEVIRCSSEATFKWFVKKYDLYKIEDKLRACTQFREQTHRSQPFDDFLAMLRVIAEN